MIYLLIILLGIAADQAVKLSVMRHLQDGELLTVISNFFNITKTVNRGAAWSFLAGQAWGIYLLTAISAVALVVLLVCVYSTKEKVNRFGLSLMAAGCAGNLIDRVLYRGVVDMFAFNFGSFHYPVFNVADICLVIGTLIFILFSSFKKNGGKDDHRIGLAA